MLSMKYYSLNEINSWERFYRANFINSLSGFKPVSLISTLHKSGLPNLAVFSNIVHLGADPALIGFINRPRQAAPHTITNIENSGVYTINHIHPSFVAKAHQTSAKYNEGVSEFEEVGLTPEYNDGVPVPFVLESSVKYALTLSEIIRLKENGTFLVIGKLTHAYVLPSIVEQDGFIDLSKAESMVSLGIDGYATTGSISRFDYAKP
jgi:flavin reductase (DIM6/NTAB) family NADH-FMN oxidoreductase RutF